MSGVNAGNTEVTVNIFENRHILFTTGMIICRDINFVLAIIFKGQTCSQPDMANETLA